MASRRCKPAFGGRLCPPKGFRWSPGSNAHANAVGRALAGKRPGSGAAARAAFSAASKAAAGGRG